MNDDVMVTVTTPRSWERTGVRLYLSDSHASNFTANMLTLLAELRAALTVLKPSAFVEGTFGTSRA